MIKILRKVIITSVIMISFIFMLLSTGCKTQDRLVSSGKVVTVPQAKEFCKENSGDSICSEPMIPND